MSTRITKGIFILVFMNDSNLFLRPVRKTEHHFLLLQVSAVMGNQPPVSSKASTQNLPDMPSTSSSSQHMSGQYLSSSYEDSKTQSRSKLSSISSHHYNTTPSSPECDVHTNENDHVNKHVSAKVIGIAANFWNSNIAGLSSEDQLVCI